MKLRTAITVLISGALAFAMLLAGAALWDANALLWNKPKALRTPADDWSTGFPFLILLALAGAEYFLWLYWSVKRKDYRLEQRALREQLETQRRVEAARELAKAAQETRANLAKQRNQDVGKRLADSYSKHLH